MTLTGSATIPVSVTAQLPPPPQPKRSWVVPDVGEYLIARHDYERADRFVDSLEYDNGAVSYQIKNEMCPYPITINFRKNPPESALPETVILWGERPTDFVPLSSEWQFWWFELLNVASEGTKTYDELITAWTSLTAQGRAFTDFHSREWIKDNGQGYEDYVLGVWPNSPNGPMQHKSLTCGGNIVRKIGTQDEYYVIEALNLSQAPPDPRAAIQKPWLVHWATQCTVLRLADGRWTMLDFPQLRPYGTPFPVISRDGTNLILKEHVNPIANGATYSPYVPEG